MTFLEVALFGIVIGWLASQILGLVALKAGLSSSLSPRVRQRRVWLIGLSAIAFPAALVLSFLLLNWIPGDHWFASHCGPHSHHHIHTCNGDLPGSDFAAPLSLALLTGLLALLVGPVRQAFRNGQRQKHLQSLLELSKGRGCLRRLNDQRPIAFAVGGASPAIVMSRGLLSGLTRRQQRIVVAHERAHLRHGDPWRSQLLAVVLSLFLPFVSKRLKAVWDHALEEAADDAVTQQFDRLEVAETLVHVLRLQLSPVEGTHAIGAGDTYSRIQRLIHGSPEPAFSVRIFEPLYAAFVLGALIVVLNQHHALETALGRLSGV